MKSPPGRGNSPSGGGNSQLWRENRAEQFELKRQLDELLEKAKHVDLTDRQASERLRQEVSVGSETTLGSDGPPGVPAAPAR